MRENPNPAAGVTIMNGATPLSICNFNQGQQPSTGVISIDYDQAIIYGLSDVEGLTLTVSYQGMGAIFLNVSRIATNVTGGVVTQTLGDVVTKASSFQYLGAYNPATSYSIFNIVTYLGVSYICTAATSLGNLPTNSAYWGKLAGNNFLGTYTGSTSYSAGDYVQNSTNDTLYISLVDANLGNALTLTSKWQVLLSVASAITSANTATTAANTAASSANTATSSANTATGLANTATSNANTATTSANNATTLATNTANALSHKGLYSGATAYVPNNIVNYNGTAFMCVQNSTGNAPSSSSTYWKKMNNFINQGTYSNAITYMYGDCVNDSVNQNVYMSIIDTNLNQLLTDTSKWQLLVTVSSAVTAANTATTNATTATTNANTATTAANTATTNANSATTSANNAATSANSLVTTFVSKGAYNGTTAYVPNNTVIYSGSSWRCLQNSTGNLPVEGVNWTLIAAAGANGAGTVASITSADASIAVTGTASIPDLSVTNASVIAKVLTGYASGAGTISATDSILQAIQKLNGNDAINANLTGDITSVGNTTTIASNVIVNANINSTAAIDPTKIADGSVTAAEFQYINSLTSNVQTQINTHLADYTLQVPYGGVTTGSANTYALAAPTISALTVGMAISVKFNVDSTAASTLNWNGKGAKGIKKSNGTDVTNLKATGIYTLRYDGTNFILQGEGGSGNATASNLLSGKTASVDAGDIVGTIPVVAGGNTITPSTASQQAIAAATYATSAISVAGDANLASPNIKAGASIFGVAGQASVVDTASATAGAGDIVNGQTAYVNGAKVTGTGANAKRYATGTVTSSATQSSYDANGVAHNMFSIVVSGLNFPTGIGSLKWYSTFNDHGWYSGTDITTTTGVKIESSDGYKYKVVAPAAISTTGFNMPVSAGSQVYTWEAWGN